MNTKRERIANLRLMLSKCGIPLRDPDLVRWTLDELFAILLDEESSEEAKIWILHDPDEHPNEDPDTYRQETEEEEEAYNQDHFSYLMGKDD